MITRGSFYLAARLLGTVLAIARGRGLARLHNIILGRVAARVLGRLWR